MDQGNQSLPGLQSLWNAERLLMRLEAQLASLPRAAVHWRSQAGLIEAVRSTELNDHVLDPATLLLALMQQQAARSRSDAGALRQAEVIWHALVGATGSGADFVAASAIGGGGLLTIEAGQAYIDSVAPANRMEWALGSIDKLGRYRSQPLLPRLAAVPLILREMNGEPSPIAERLWLMLADHKWRRPAPIISSRPALEVRGELVLDRPADARWIVAPASLLSLGGPGLWNPAGPDYREKFVRGAERWLNRELDNLLRIARWEANELTSFALSGRNGARVRLTRMIARMPILDAPMVARNLQVHERTALRLLNEAGEAKVLTELMGRYQYRIWAAPSLALWAQSTHQDRRRRPAKVGRWQDRDGRTGAPETGVAPRLPGPAEPASGWESDRAEKDARLQAMLDDIDALSKGVLEIAKRTTNSVEAVASARSELKGTEDGANGWLQE